jgi:hypothetical protein
VVRVSDKNLYRPAGVLKGPGWLHSRTPGPSEGSIFDLPAKSGGILLAKLRRKKRYKAAGKPRRQAKATPIAYLVIDNYWNNVLPNSVTKAAQDEFNRAYKFNGAQRMTIKPTDMRKVPGRINLFDAIIRVYKTSAEASRGFEGTVRDQLRQIRGFALSIPKSDFKVAIGRTATIKRVLGAKPRKSRNVRLICVTESAVALERTLGAWRISSEKQWKKKIGGVTSTNWLRSLKDPDLLKWFGAALGRAMAHEVLHQLYSGPGYGLLPHASSGIGADPNNQASKWWARKAGFSQFDQGRIKTWTAKLKLLQGQNVTERVIRRWVRK